MKSFLQRSSIALLVCALVAVAAFAGGKDKIRKETVTFSSDVMVNGTLIKAGDYEVRFNEQTGELAIAAAGENEQPDRAGQVAAPLGIDLRQQRFQR